MGKPNFFIIGAPRCGTTSLARWLAEHPNIYVSHKKEPHFFNQDGLRTTESLEEYEALFAQSGPEHVAIGEASTHYLYSREAVPRILEYDPEAKFIVCLRNPLEMAPSLHAERVWQGREPIKHFEEAWHLQAERRKGTHIPRTLRKDPARLQYGAYCRLGEQLARLYEHVAQKRVLVLLLDDMARDARGEYQKVLSFLGVPDDGREEFPVYNRRKGVRFAYLSYIVKYLQEMKLKLGINWSFRIVSFVQNDLNSCQRASTGLPPELKNELLVYFEDDVHLLERLLNRDLSRWSR